MIEFKQIISDIISEVSYRTDNGIVNFKNPTHISILSEVLDEMGLGVIKDELFQNMFEDANKSDDEYKGIGGQPPQYVKSNDFEKYQKNPSGFTGQKFQKTDSGTYVEVDADGNDVSKDGGISIFSPESGYEAPDLDRGDDAEIKPSPEVSDIVYGSAGMGDTDVKNDMFKYGFGGYQSNTGKPPAPGSAGSAFNEIASGEGVHMLKEDPDMSEEELARKMYEQYKETALGKEQSQSSGVGSIPSDIENPKLYSKCVISARSARTKYDITQQRVESLQADGKFGTLDKIDTYYGAAESIDAQVIAISDANKVLLPNGDEVSKEDATAFIRAGGGGVNPSDTATFAKDKSGNLLIQFHSDKTSTADIQDNSTLSQEGVNYKNSIDKTDGLSDEDKVEAKSIVDEYSSKMANIEERYNDQTAKIAGRLSELPIDDQLNIIEADTGTLAKNIEVAIFGKSGKIKTQFTEYLPSDATPDSLTLKEKYEAIRRLVADGNGKSGEVKVISKVGLALQSKNPSIEGIDVKQLISKEREQVVNLQRERVEVLNKKSVDIDGVRVQLGTLMEAEETIRGFHLSLMDYPPKTYENGNPTSMIGSAFDVNMGGANVNGEILRRCIGVNTTTELKQRFRIIEADELVKDSDDNVTGKTVFVYAVDAEGRQLKIGKKSYRSKSGATGKTNNTFTYSTELQTCFKSK